ncbi:MAG: 4-hydroxy-tetrahydrodipicolinate synthase [Mariprofundaceae bacterium]
MFHGTMTALITPFKDGEIDEAAFRDHLDRQIDAGVDALIPAGTTGEAATLSFEEHKRLIQITVDHTAGRVPVIAGTGANCTAESIELTSAAKDAGASAALLISPYYNKPTQDGVFQHYKAVAEAVHLPIIAYNVPGRTHSNITPETVGRLANISNIVGIKDATADMAQFTRTILACDGKMEFYSGDDATVMPFMAIGGTGVISVVSNIAPNAMKSLTTTMANSDLASARRQHLALLHLCDAMFVESNPIPVKAACAMMGWTGWDIRLPLTQLPAAAREMLYAALIDFGLKAEFKHPA